MYRTPWSESVPFIIVDSHEVASGIVPILESRELFEVRVERLEVGDFALADLCIERKTGADLVASIEDGRLFKQLLLLRRTYKRRLLLIEGDIPSAPIAKRAVQGALVRISAGLQIPILFSKSLDDTVSLLHRAALQLYGFTSAQFHSLKAPSNADLQFHQSYVLAGIPGIGVHRARQLIEHFGSLKHILSATRAELAAVPGTGEVQAERIERLANYRKDREGAHPP